MDADPIAYKNDYLRDLKNDLERIGFNPERFEDTVSILDLLENLDFKKCYRFINNGDNFTPSTDAGETLVGWGYTELNPRFSGLVACPKTEPNFVASLLSANVKEYLSPIIITHEGRPVGLAKQFGEKTVLSFANIPEKGFSESAICHVEDLLKIKKLRAKVGAYAIEINQLRAGLTKVLRPSLFLVPSEVRRVLTDSTSSYVITNRDGEVIYTIPIDIAIEELENKCHELLNDDTITYLEVGRNGVLRTLESKRPQTIFA